jgi:hypothetical protein
LAHTPPPLVDALAIGDFVSLVLSVDAYRAAMEKSGRG